MLYDLQHASEASANKGKYDTSLIAKPRAAYWDDLDRAARGKPPLPPRERSPEVKPTKLSRTDPDAGYMVRDGKPRAVSGKVADFSADC